jgi:hypothetical protein
MSLGTVTHPFSGSLLPRWNTTKDAQDNESQDARSGICMVLASRRAGLVPAAETGGVRGCAGRRPALLAGVSVKVNLLTSWAATLDGAEPAIVTER